MRRLRFVQALVKYAAKGGAWASEADRATGWETVHWGGRWVSGWAGGWSEGVGVGAVDLGASDGEENWAFV